MLPLQKVSHESPGPAAACGSAAASPFISLSMQCELLYHVGSQPHSHACISEQSVYNRAAEQLRFHLPTPSLQRASPIQSHGAQTESSSTSSVYGNAEASPHVYVAPPPLPCFPPIRLFEQTRIAEEQREQQQRRQAPSSSWRTASEGNSSSSSTQARMPRQLVPSGIDLATCTFQSDFMASKAPTTYGVNNIGYAERHDLQESLEVVDSTLQESVASTPAPPQGPNSPLAFFFRPAVVARAVAQMVLTLQASKQSSAAHFSLAQYRGIPLPAWVRAVKCDPSLLAKTESPVFRDALVFSVLPQVVADWIADQKGSLKGQEDHARDLSSSERAAVFYAVTPRIGFSSSSVPMTAGRKHQRAERPAEAEGPFGAAAEPPTVFDVVGCTRLSGPSLSSLQLSLTYCAVTPEDLQTPHPSSCDTAHQSAKALGNAVDSIHYSDEAEWLTHGVLHRLFTLPTTPSRSASATGGDNAAAVLLALPKDVPSKEQRESAHTVFLKTNAFLFLSFLVHHSWCLHVHEAVATALEASLKERNVGQGATQKTSFVATCATCLPQLNEVRRSPQHEWISELTYRFYKLKGAGDESAPQTFSTHTGKTPAAREWVWQLTVKVINRSAELHWYHCGRLSGCVQDAPASVAGETLTSPRAGRSATTVEGTGALQELMKQL
ncbi:hypothetical protein ABL78_4489 [Leptomonas seymouri]|uniref:Uncharacterized protein n=1 Tax=Leptomonas seymouri TaxID=5684 RepID=A0A0N1I6C8_LEPSE|nr:hypothetical protein ABL78_4489 [Leptomonas seymouri]|eukprot:KPI86458.1 hypothetical protein ABL78_4489 [Leptomonas seymouri]